MIQKVIQSFQKVQKNYMSWKRLLIKASKRAKSIIWLNGKISQIPIIPGNHEKILLKTIAKI